MLMTQYCASSVALVYRFFHTTDDRAKPIPSFESGGLLSQLTLSRVRDQPLVLHGRDEGRAVGSLTARGVGSSLTIVML